MGAEGCGWATAWCVFGLIAMIGAVVFSRTLGPLLDQPYEHLRCAVFDRFAHGMAMPVSGFFSLLTFDRAIGT